jgi:hypothetical protein
LLIPALIATSGVVSVLHVHDYDDHDHPEHHHGLGVHEHHALPVPPDDGTPRLEGCDPGRHTVAFAFVCAAPPLAVVVDAAVDLPASPIPEPQIDRAVRYADVRVHGPPPRTQTSPRSPPLIAHT